MLKAQRKNGMLSATTQQKRNQLLTFIERKLQPVAAVRGVVGIGSIALGTMRADSDIDAIIFMEPLDLYVAPAEAIWLPTDDSFHSIFSQDQAVHEQGVQFDFVRVDRQQWTDPAYPVEEGRLAELAEGWIAFDRDGGVAQLIAERTHYPAALRRQRLDAAIVTLDGHLKWDDPAALWEALGPARAHDRLNAAYSYLVQALFAYNQCWRGWRNREMSYLLRLSWLPDKFEERVLIAQNAPSLDVTGYTTRFQLLRTLLDELLVQLTTNGDYGPEPVDEAFIRSHEEPGRAWNLQEWVAMHHRRRSS